MNETGHSDGRVVGALCCKHPGSGYESRLWDLFPLADIPLPHILGVITAETEQFDSIYE